MKDRYQNLMINFCNVKKSLDTDEIGDKQKT